jgi:hypothetical protein
MRVLVPLGGVLIVIGLSACAGKNASTNPGGGGARWSGAFKHPPLSSSATVGPAPPGRAAGYGSITLTPLPETPTRTRVELSISAPVAPGTQLAWAVFSGGCGAATPPLLGPNEFPTIEISNSGGGMVRTELALALDTHVTHHANIYWSSRVSDVSNVMLCANLAYSGER